MDNIQLFSSQEDVQEECSKELRVNLFYKISIIRSLFVKSFDHSNNFEVDLTIKFKKMNDQQLIQSKIIQRYETQLINLFFDEDCFVVSKF